MSREVAELKNERMKVHAGLVMASDVDSRLETATKERDELAAEKKVNSLSEAAMFASC